MKKNIIFSVLVIILLSFMTGCGKKGELQSKKEMLDSIDNLSCADESTTENTNSPLLCNLKNNYTVVNEEVSSDELGKVRKINLRLNASDLEFSVTSSYKCSESFDASCTEHTYTITTDYKGKANDYFSKKYSEQKNNDICNSSNYPFCSVNNKNEIATVTEYVYGYIDYLNSLNVKFLSYSKHISIEFPSKTYVNGVNYSAYIYITLIDGKYVLQTSGPEVSTINDLNEYLLNWSDEQTIF